MESSEKASSFFSSSSESGSLGSGQEDSQSSEDEEQLKDNIQSLKKVRGFEKLKMKLVYPHHHSEIEEFIKDTHPVVFLLDQDWPPAELKLLRERVRGFKEQRDLVSEVKKYLKKLRTVKIFIMAAKIGSFDQALSSKLSRSSRSSHTLTYIVYGDQTPLQTLRIQPQEFITLPNFDSLQETVRSMFSTGFRNVIAVRRDNFSEIHKSRLNLEWIKSLPEESLKLFFDYFCEYILMSSKFIQSLVETEEEDLTREEKDLERAQKRKQMTTLLWNKYVYWSQQKDYDVWITLYTEEDSYFFGYVNNILRTQESPESLSYVGFFTNILIKSIQHYTMNPTQEQKQFKDFLYKDKITPQSSQSTNEKQNQQHAQSTNEKQTQQYAEQTKQTINLSTHSNSSYNQNSQNQLPVPEFHNTLYRTFLRSQFDEFEEGNVVCLLGFLSTSLLQKEDLLAHLSNQDLMKIILPHNIDLSSEQFIYLGNISKMKGEREVIFSPSCFFTVLKVDTIDSSSILVTLEYIPIHNSRENVPQILHDYLHGEFLLTNLLNDQSCVYFIKKNFAKAETIYQDEAINDQLAGRIEEEEEEEEDEEEDAEVIRAAMRKNQENRQKFRNFSGHLLFRDFQNQLEPQKIEIKKNTSIPVEAKNIKLNRGQFEDKKQLYQKYFGSKNVFTDFVDLYTSSENIRSEDELKRHLKVLCEFKSESLFQIEIGFILSFVAGAKDCQEFNNRERLIEKVNQILVTRKVLKKYSTFYFLNRLACTLFQLKIALESLQYVPRLLELIRQRAVYSLNSEFKRHTYSIQVKLYLIDLTVERKGKLSEVASKMIEELQNQFEDGEKIREQICILMLLMNKVEIIGSKKMGDYLEEGVYRRVVGVLFKYYVEGQNWRHQPGEYYWLMMLLSKNLDGPILMGKQYLDQDNQHPHDPFFTAEHSIRKGLFLQQGFHEATPDQLQKSILAIIRSLRCEARHLAQSVFFYPIFSLFTKEYTKMLERVEGQWQQALAQLESIYQLCAQIYEQMGQQLTVTQNQPIELALILKLGILQFLYSSGQRVSAAQGLQLCELYLLRRRQASIPWSFTLHTLEECICRVFLNRIEAPYLEHQHQFFGISAQLIEPPAKHSPLHFIVGLYRLLTQPILQIHHRKHKLTAQELGRALKYYECLKIQQTKTVCLHKLRMALHKCTKPLPAQMAADAQPLAKMIPIQPAFQIAIVMPNTDKEIEQFLTKKQRALQEQLKRTCESILHLHQLVHVDQEIFDYILRYSRRSALSLNVCTVLKKSLARPQRHSDYFVKFLTENRKKYHKKLNDWVQQMSELLLPSNAAINEFQFVDCVLACQRWSQRVFRISRELDLFMKVLKILYGYSRYFQWSPKQRKMTQFEMVLHCCFYFIDISFFFFKRPFNYQMEIGRLYLQSNAFFQTNGQALDQILKPKTSKDSPQGGKNSISSFNFWDRQVGLMWMQVYCEQVMEKTMEMSREREDRPTLVVLEKIKMRSRMDTN